MAKNRPDLDGYDPSLDEDGNPLDTGGTSNSPAPPNGNASDATPGGYGQPDMKSRAGKAITALPGYIYGDDGITPIASTPTTNVNPDPSSPRVTGSDGNTGINPSAPYTPAPNADIAPAISISSPSDVARSQFESTTRASYPSWSADRVNQAVDYFMQKYQSAGATPENLAYFLDRAAGNGAGGADVAEAGQYAGRDFGPEVDPLASTLATASVSQNYTPYTPPPVTPITPSVPYTPAPTPQAPTAPQDNTPAAPISFIAPDQTGGIGGKLGQTANTPLATQSTPQLDAATQAALLRALSGPSADDIAQNIGNDPAVIANRRATDRGYGDIRANAAEQAVTGGTNSSGGFSGKLRGLDEDRIDSEAQYAGGRTAQAVAARQQELQNAIQVATSAGETDKAQQLQKQLADLSASVTTRGQDINNSQFQQQLRQNSNQFLSSLGLSYDTLNANQRNFLANLGQDDAHFGATLTQNQKQFLDSLGLSYAQLTAQQRQAISQLAQQNAQFNNTLGYNYADLEERSNHDAAVLALGGS